MSLRLSIFGQRDDALGVSPGLWIISSKEGRVQKQNITSRDQRGEYPSVSTGVMQVAGCSEITEEE